MLVAIHTHPIQYHAPLYRAIQHRSGVPVTAVYGSDFSIHGYRDAEFGTTFAWDTDLLSGYSSVFLSRVASGGARDVTQVATHGLGAALARLRPSAVLIAGYSPQFHRSAFLAAWRHRLPILFRAETTDREPESATFRSIRRTALRTLYSRCHRLLYIGARSRRHYEALGIDQQSLVFSPYCVDATSFDAAEQGRERHRGPTRAAIGVSDNELMLVFCGKLTPKKRPDLLVHAVPRLRQALARSIAVVFVGDGELRPELESLSHSLGVKAHFAGFKQQSTISPYYHAADVMVLPSQHSETWGLVINEALMHGLPCVVSNAVGCGDDLIRPSRTGDVFSVGSVEELADALVRASALADRPEIRHECRMLVSGYSLDRAADGVVSAYRSVESRAH